MQKIIATNIVKELLPYKRIVFGPFVGEFGWEILRFSGFVRWYKNNYPNKEIFVSTRESSKDLYTGCVDDMDLFRLEGDYSSFSPNCYHGSGLKEDQYKELLLGVESRFPKSFIFQPFKYGCFRNVFNFEQMDFNYTPDINNKKMIDHIKSFNNGRKCICVASRQRKDISLRNWGEKRWKDLINLFERGGKFTVFIIGKGNSYVRSGNGYKNVFNIEDYVNYENDITDIGLGIEAIKTSKLVVGVQSGAILLSNLIGTPTLMWGHEVKRHSIDENIKKTKCIAIDDPTYSTDPVMIYKKVVGDFK